METTRQMTCIQELKELKRDAQEMQKKGLPFMMASVVIWTLILLVRLSHFEITRANLFTFMCSCFLMPLAFLFSKLLKTDIFQKSQNPINKLGFLCTMNQMLYLTIVMWAFNQVPEAMLMLYACVFGAHLLPYGWVYDHKAYAVTVDREVLLDIDSRGNVPFTYELEYDCPWLICEKKSGRVEITENHEESGKDIIGDATENELQNVRATICFAVHRQKISGKEEAACLLKITFDNGQRTQPSRHFRPWKAMRISRRHLM